MNIKNTLASSFWGENLQMREKNFRAWKTNIWLMKFFFSIENFIFSRFLLGKLAFLIFLESIISNNSKSIKYGSQKFGGVILQKWLIKLKTSKFWEWAFVVFILLNSVLILNEICIFKISNENFNNYGLLPAC